jgi:hypothetical protein
MLTGHPERPQAYQKHGSAALVAGRGEGAVPDHGRAARLGSAHDSEDVDAHEDPPEEPGREGQLLGDKISDGDHPGREKQDNVAHSCEGPNPLLLDQGERPQREGRDGGPALGQPVKKGEAERDCHSAPEHPGGREPGGPAGLVGTGAAHERERDLGEREAEPLMRDPLPLQEGKDAEDTYKEGDHEGRPCRQWLPPEAPGHCGTAMEERLCGRGIGGRKPRGDLLEKRGLPDHVDAREIVVLERAHKHPAHGCGADERPRDQDQRVDDEQLAPRHPNPTKQGKGAGT